MQTTQHPLSPQLPSEHACHAGLLLLMKMCGDVDLNRNTIGGSQSIAWNMRAGSLLDKAKSLQSESSAD